MAAAAKQTSALMGISEFAEHGDIRFKLFSLWRTILIFFKIKFTGNRLTFPLFVKVSFLN